MSAKQEPIIGAVVVVAALSVVACYGCDPIVTIAGANFPDWLLCLTVGAILVLLLRPLLVRSRLEPNLGPLTIFYPSLIGMFAMIVWVMFFNRT